MKVTKLFILLSMFVLINQASAQLIINVPSRACIDNPQGPLCQKRMCQFNCKMQKRICDFQVGVANFDPEGNPIPPVNQQQCNNEFQSCLSQCELIRL